MTKLASGYHMKAIKHPQPTQKIKHYIILSSFENAGSSAKHTKLLKSKADESFSLLIVKWRHFAGQFSDIHALALSSIYKKMY